MNEELIERAEEKKEDKIKPLKFTVKNSVNVLL